MSFWTILLVIAVIGAVLSYKRARDGGFSARRFDDGNEGHGTPGHSPRESELLQEVEQLRERVKVLERIATDANSREARESRAIADEIESLRDK